MITGSKSFGDTLHRRVQSLALVLATLGLACLLSTISYAQVTSGDILGTVTDQSGAVIPGAKVHVVNTATNVPQDVTTNGDGDYEFPYLINGTYELSIAAPGFKVFRQTNIQLNVDQKYRVDAKLAVGNAAQTVTVAANAAVLQTDQSQLSDTIDMKEVEEMPNVNHNPLLYVELEPGVVPTGAMFDPQQVNTNVTGRQNFSSFVVNGSQPMMSNIQLDGSNDTNPNANEIAIVPSMESIGEVRVVTNAYSAEYGRAAGGVINFTTKSGQNLIHGSLYNAFRNRDLNANTFGNNTFGRYVLGTAPCLAGTCAGKPIDPRPPFTTNQFGGNISGPVKIPHIYNGTNKTFIYTGFEGLRRSQGSSTYYTVPTALEQAGNFSQTTEATTVSGQPTDEPVNIYMPFPNTSTFTVVGTSYNLIRQQACSTGPVTNAPITGNASGPPLVAAGHLGPTSYSCPGGGIANVIPAVASGTSPGGAASAYFDPTQQQRMLMYPLPDQPAENTDGSLNYFTNDPTWTDTNQWAIKIDQNFSEKAKMFFRFTQDWTYTSPPDIFLEGGAADSAAPTQQRNPAASIGLDWTLSPNSVVEMRMNVTRVNLQEVPFGGLNYDLSGCTGNGLCFNPNMLVGLPSHAFPMFAAPGVGSGQSWVQQGTGNFVLAYNHSTVVDFTPNFTKIHGNWTHKIGMEYNAMLYNFNQPQSASMTFSPGTTGFSAYCEGTGCPVDVADNVYGYAPATFDYGQTTTAYGGGQYTSNEPAVALKNAFWSIYSQNDWKATKKLTVNLGLRWEDQVPLTERHNRLTQFNLGGTNVTGTPGVYEFSGVNGIPRGQTNVQHTNFAPRIGYAYRLGEKTVIRSAYGISYVMITGVGSGAQGFGADGWSVADYQQTLPTTGSTLACAPACELDDILANPMSNSFSTGGVSANGNPASPQLLGKASVTAIVRTDYKVPYMQQWNFTVQRQLPLATSLQVAYVGSKGTKIGIQQAPINQTDDVALSTLYAADATLADTDINPMANKVPNPFFGIITGNTALNGTTITNLQADEPYPAYGGVTRFQDRLGNSSYNALQILAKHTFGHGVMIQGTYTWAHSLDYGNGYTGQIQTGNSPGGLLWLWQNRSLDRAPSGFDKTHVAVISYVWRLPFGKGQSFVTKTPVATQILEGWTIAGITSFTDGFPIGITGGGFGRPNLIGNPKLAKANQIIGTGTIPINLPTGQTFTPPNKYKMWFNPDAWTIPTLVAPVTSTPGTFQNVTDPYFIGSSPRLFDDLRAPGINDFDLTLSRTFNLTERFKMEARIQAYNAFNRVQFGSPGVGFGGPSLLTANGPIGYNTSTTFGDINTGIAQNAPSATTNTSRFMDVSLYVRW